MTLLTVALEINFMGRHLSISFDKRKSPLNLECAACLMPFLDADSDDCNGSLPHVLHCNHVSITEALGVALLA